MFMLEMEQIRQNLNKFSIKYVHENTGISLETLYKIRSGDRINTSYKTGKILSDFFKKEHQCLINSETQN